MTENKYQFLLEEKIPQGYRYQVNELDDSMIDALAETLTFRQYRELCHQLHGTKAEFDEVDGECSVGDDAFAKFRYTIKSALSREIFWETLGRLNSLAEDNMENLNDEYDEESYWHGFGN